MASGFFCVTGPCHLELRLEPGPDHGVERVVVDLPVMDLLHPLAQRFVGGNPGWLPERLLQGVQHIWGQGDGLPSRHVHIQQGLQASGLVNGEPVANGMAMDAQQPGHGLTCLGLPAGQHIEHLEAWFLMTIALPSYAFFERDTIFGHNREDLAHRLLSSMAEFDSLSMRADLCIVFNSNSYKVAAELQRDAGPPAPAVGGYARLIPTIKKASSSLASKFNKSI
jgi:hypothetical protein